MGIAYVVCFVALLQISLCMPTEDSTPMAETSSELTSPSEPEASPSSEVPSTSTEEQQSTVPSVEPSTTTDSEEEETLSYETVTEGNNATSTMEPEPSSTSHPGHASLFSPNTLVFFVPVFIRLFSTKLLGHV